MFPQVLVLYLIVRILVQIKKTVVRWLLVDDVENDLCLFLE